MKGWIETKWRYKESPKDRSRNLFKHFASDCKYDLDQIPNRTALMLTVSQQRKLFLANEFHMPPIEIKKTAH